MCDDKEMITNNKYRDFKTKIGDEFKEMGFDGHEHEFPSNIFNELDMNTLGSVWGHYSFIVPMVIDMELCKGMICEDK